MTRITISVPDELAATVTREAKRRGETVSAVVRAALRAFLLGRRKLPIAALGRSGRRHTARDAEKILAQEWRLDRGR